MMIINLIFVLFFFYQCFGGVADNLISSTTLHSCVVMKDRMNIRCWGSEALGPGLGYGVGDVGTGTPSTDGRILGIADVGDVNLQTSSAIVGVFTGFFFTCVHLEAGGGTVKCWGSNQYGQLGNGNYDDLATPPSSSDQLVQLPGPVDNLAVGYQHACAIVGQTAVYCWGDNAKGQVGLDPNTNETVATPVAVDFGSAVSARPVSLAAGQEHTCVLLADNSLVCWGSNGSGQCGQQPSLQTVLPRPANVPPVPQLSEVGTMTDLVAGAMSTCVVFGALSQVYCFGDNDDGRLGNGLKSPVVAGNRTVVGAMGASSTAIAEANPISLGVPGVLAVAAGSRHTVAVNENGQVRSWGAISGGRLGFPGTLNWGDDPSRLPSAAPFVSFPLGTRIVAASAGFSHTCVLSDASEVFCFGTAGSGLGYNSTENVGDQPDNEPVDVGPVPLGGPAALVPLFQSTTSASLPQSNATELAMESPDGPAPGVPLDWWVWLLIVLLILCLSLFIVFFVYKLRQRRRSSQSA